MTFHELLKQTSARGELARNRRFLEVFLTAVKKTVRKQGHFMMPKFATFNVRDIKARKVRNPQTMEVMRLPKMKTVKIRASASWR